MGPFPLVSATVPRSNKPGSVWEGRNFQAELTLLVWVAIYRKSATTVFPISRINFSFKHLACIGAVAGLEGGHGTMDPPLSLEGTLSAPEGTLKVPEGMVCKLQ